MFLLLLNKLVGMIHEEGEFLLNEPVCTNHEDGKLLLNEPVGTNREYICSSEFIL